MSAIIPTITSESKEAYAQEIERVQGFAPRIHIDFADGVFAPTKLVGPSQAWWPDGIEADLHVMLQDPASELMTLLSLKPRLIIIHAESNGDVLSILKEVQALGVKAGIGILPRTQIDTIAQLVETADHALIFGGKLGYHGGDADLTQLDKITLIKAIAPNIEIGWDGGANLGNVAQLAAAGVDCINVGGAIQHADDPEGSYRELEDHSR